MQNTRPFRTSLQLILLYLATKIKIQEVTVMTRDELAVLCDARDKLCGYCQSDECEKCIVTALIDDAYNETPEEELE